MLKAYGAEVVVCPTAVAARPPRLLLLRRPTGSCARSTAPGSPNQYSNPDGPALALRDDRPGDLGRHRRPGHPLRRRRRHRRHHHRHRPLPARGLRRPRGRPGPDRRRRPRGLGLLRRHGPPLPRRGRRRGLLARAPTTRRSSTRSIAVSRRRLVRDDPSPRPRGGPARRRLLRHGRRRGPARGQGPARGRRRRRAAARLRPRLHVEDLQRRVDELLRLHAAPTARRTVGDVLHTKAGDIPALVHTHPTETVRDAIEILREYGVSQMPVVKAEPPGHGRRGGRRGQRARPARGAVRRQGAPGRLGRAAHGAGAAAGRRRRADRRRRATSSRTPTRSWSSRTASPWAC